MRNGHFDVGVTLTMVIFITISMIVLFNMYIGSGTIVINKPFEKEYKQCQSQLQELQKLKTPTTSCHCDYGSSGLTWAILGFLLYAGGMAFFWWRNSELDKRAEEISKREEEFKKKK